MVFKTLAPFLLCSFLASTAFSFASDLSSQRGKWAFDHMNPLKAKCELIDDRYLKRHSKSKAVCFLSETGGYSETAQGPVYVCDGIKFSRMVSDTQTSCEQHLQAELANGN